MCTHALHRLPFTLALSCYASCTGTECRGGITGDLGPNCLHSFPQTNCKAPNVSHSPCLPLSHVSSSSIFFLLVYLPFWQAGALCEQPRNSAATLMAAEAFIWQGNRISSTELPPATVHTETYIKPCQYTQRGKEIEFNWKACRETTGEGLFVLFFVPPPALLCSTLNIKINKKTWFALWWSVTEKKHNKLVHDEQIHSSPSLCTTHSNVSQVPFKFRHAGLKWLAL